MPTDLLDKSLKILAKEMRTTKPFMDHLVAKKAPQTSHESPTISQADHSAYTYAEVYHLSQVGEDEALLIGRKERM